MDKVNQPGKRQSAAEKIDAQRAAAARQRRRLLIAGGSVLAVLIIVVAFIAVKLDQSPAKNSGHVTSSSSVASQITSVPASTLDAVGKGTATALEPTVGNQPLLTAQGKPEVLYIGGEFCPFCAAERWAMAVALSRFGTFSGLNFIHSSSTDEFPNTPTLTFYKSTYTSKYVVFTPVEWYTVSKTLLQPPTSAQMALFTKYDAPPYVTAADAGSFPFVDFGNKDVIIGSQYFPTPFAGLTWSQVATDIRNPSSAIAKDVDGAANTMTAELCKLTNGQPGNVCSSPGVTAATAHS
jgi:thiol-disulfide isomerase/thioredoxin